MNQFEFVKSIVRYGDRIEDGDFRGVIYSIGGILKVQYFDNAFVTNGHGNTGEVLSSRNLISPRIYRRSFTSALLAPRGYTEKWDLVGDYADYKKAQKEKMKLLTLGELYEQNVKRMNTSPSDDLLDVFHVIESRLRALEGKEK